MLPRSGEGREAGGCPRWGFSLQASPLQWFRFRCTGWGRNFGVRLILTILSLPYIEVSINIQSVRYHLVNHPFSLFRGPVARPAPGPTHPHRSPLKPSVYCAEPSPSFPDVELVARPPATLPRSRPDIPTGQGWGGGSREAVRAGCVARRTLWSRIDSTEDNSLRRNSGTRVPIPGSSFSPWEPGTVREMAAALSRLRFLSQATTKA